MFEKNPASQIPQIDAMRLGVDYRLELKLREFSVPVRPITISETLEIASRVGAHMARLPEASRNRVTEHVLLAKETLKVASTSDVGKQDMQLTDIILDKMTPDELTFAYKQYVSATDKVNPALEQLSKEEIEDIYELVKKNQSQLIECSFLQLVNLARYLLTQSD